MKKLSVLLILMILVIVPLGVYAELSTNLNVVKVPVSNNRRLTDSETYTDAEGNVVVPSDKGYATKKYEYGTGFLQRCRPHPAPLF